MCCYTDKKNLQQKLTIMKRHIAELKGGLNQYIYLR